MSYQIYDIERMMQNLSSQRCSFDNYVFLDPTAAQQMLKRFMLETEQILGKMKEVLSRQDSDICGLMADVPSEPNDHNPSWLVTAVPEKGCGYAKPRPRREENDIPF